MKVIFLILLFVIAAPLRAESVSDETAIRDIVANEIATCNTGDAVGYSRDFCENGNAHEYSRPILHWLCSVFENT